MTDPSERVTLADAAAILGVDVDEVERLARDAKFGAWWSPGQPLARKAVEAYRDRGLPRQATKRAPAAPWASGAAAQARATPRPAAPSPPPPPPRAPVPAPPVERSAPAPVPPLRAHAHAHAYEDGPEQRRGGRRGGGGVENVRPGRLVEARTRALLASEQRTANQDAALREAIVERRAAGDGDEKIRAGLVAGGMPEARAARYI